MIKKRALYGDYMLVFIVNKSLKMSKGKIISQVAHAITNLSSMMYNDTKLYKSWMANKKDIKIYQGVLEDIEELCNKAHKNEIRYAKIHDAGRTQIPSGSNTVLIIGPALKEKCENWFSALEILE
jgi:peptidyl-tRNA hydrolase, PTH2 family